MLVVEQYGSNNDIRVMINSEIGQEFEGSSFDLYLRQKVRKDVLLENYFII